MRFYRYLTLPLLLLLLNACATRQSTKKIPLNDGWEFFAPNIDQPLSAKVPGNVHNDLYINELIPDYFVGTNSDSLAWVSDSVWRYRRRVRLTDDMLQGNVELLFEGLDTYATIYFNGVQIGTADNQHLSWSFPVPDTLRHAGNNLVEVHFSPSSQHNAQEAQKSGNGIPGNTVYTRKAAYQYGWDFAPNLETCGIFRDVYLCHWKKMNLRHALFKVENLTDTLATVVADIDLEAEHFYNAHVTISSPDNEFDTLRSKMDIFEGRQTYPIAFTIRNPELWWCNGMGKQKLYDVDIQIDTKFRTVEYHGKIGLRTVELHADVDSSGQEFYFTLNGKPVFARGANWVPCEYFCGSNSYDNYRQLLDMAKYANINMLRVWGGGNYEDNRFYALCDSLGIMVWQDFMFACAMYPLDDPMRESICQEVGYQVSRLYNHPSIVLWCGNNEISNGWFDWGWQQQFGISPVDSVRLWNDYDRLFHRIIPAAVARIDKSRAYIPSSPAFGWGRRQSLTCGDSHYWGVWWGMEDFNAYLKHTGRFVSEYGFQSLPCMASLQKFVVSTTDSLQLRRSLKTHQKHPTGFATINEYMLRDFDSVDNLPDYVYVSQLLQAEGVQKAFDAHLAAMPYCMGSLFWQLNDCWPAISWSAIDYYKQPKALYYFARKAFQNLSVAAFQNDDDKLQVFAINHTDADLTLQAGLVLTDFYGRTLHVDSVVFVADKCRSTAIDFPRLCSDTLVRHADSCFVNIVLTDFGSGKQLCSRSVTLGKPKNLRLPPARLVSDVQPVGDSYEIRLKSPTFVKSLCLTARNVDGFFSDNFFDLLPNTVYTVRFYPRTSMAKPMFELRSLNDIVSRRVDK